MESRPITTVSSEIELQLVVPGESTVPLPVRLRYRADDPYALHAEFRTGSTETVEWVFARDLLATGVHRPAGQGDIRVWPSAGSGGRTVYVSLTSPDGQALLEAPGQALVAFLQRTYDVVPAGEETRHLDLDSELDALLRQ